MASYIEPIPLPAPVIRAVSIPFISVVRLVNGRVAQRRALAFSGPRGSSSIPGASVFAIFSFLSVRKL